MTGDPFDTVPVDALALVREHLPAVLIEHQRVDIGHCRCGWGADAGNLGQSHAHHVTDAAVQAMAGA